MKEIMKTHLITILCVISLIVLFLPFVTVTVEMEIMGISSGESQSLSGFTAATYGITGLVLIVGPILLIAMNYIKQLGKYKGLLAIAVPIICIIFCIIVIIQAKSLAVKAMGGDFGYNIKISPAIGSILALLSYIGTAVAGAMTYHNFTLDQVGLERLKQEGAQLLQSAKTSVTETAQNVSEAIQNADKSDASTGASGIKPTAKKQVNFNRMDEALTMIEKMSKMKDEGILTEDEFTEKKRQLLSEI